MTGASEHVAIVGPGSGRRRSACGAATIALALLIAAPATAQEFAEASSSAPPGTPHASLERGLPAAGEVAFQAARIGWHGVDGLETRSVSVGGAWGPWRATCGASQTGAGEWGWQAAGLGLGHATAAGGIGVRGLVRRDAGARADGPLGPGVGLDAGLGAWIVAGPGVWAWASAPQVWTRGAAPALARPLALGARVEVAGLMGWIERTAPARAGDPLGSAAVGIALVGPRALAFVEVLDRPLRASLGVAARAGALSVAVRADDHPVLGDTVRLSVNIGGGTGAEGPEAVP